MAQELRIDTQAPVLVEIAPRSGMRPVARTIEDMQEESFGAINSAMSAIYSTATMVNNTIEKLAVKPSQVEVNFGVKLIAETGAVIAKAGGEANFNVKITWMGK